jgi:hypothetical protein
VPLAGVGTSATRGRGGGEGRTGCWNGKGARKSGGISRVRANGRLSHLLACRAGFQDPIPGRPGTVRAQVKQVGCRRPIRCAPLQDRLVSLSGGTVYRVVITCVLFVALAAGGSIRAAGVYPMALAVTAQVKSGATTVTSTFAIRIERLMTEPTRTKVTDALRFGGYQNFLPALRAAPVVGTIALDKREVQLRYAREQPDEQGTRLTLVADKPLFFFGADPSKARAGYELTVVDLRLDANGAGTGTMAGAARVKPAPGGAVILDTYAEAPVELTIRPDPSSK